MNSQTIKNVTLALFLGAIGSGIWSMVGEPFVGWFIDNFIVLAQSLNNSFYDSLHENIGKGFYEDHSLFIVTVIRIIFLFLVVGLPIFSFKLWKRSENIGKEETDDNKKELSVRIAEASKSAKRLFLFSLLLSFIGGPLYISRIIISEYNSNAIVFTERSIEILSPLITDEQRLKLRAMYRSVSNASEFYALYDSLKDSAKKHSIELPEFEVAR